jgi:chromosomal replication initiation ATPase DnaA
MTVTEQVENYCPHCDCDHIIEISMVLQARNRKVISVRNRTIADDNFVHRLQDSVCNNVGITVPEMFVTDRRVGSVFARHVYMTIMKKEYPQMGYAEIASCFDQDDRTAMYARRCIRNMMTCPNDRERRAVVCAVLNELYNRPGIEHQAR